MKQEDIDNIANNTADIIESDFKDQKYQIISEDKIIEILKKETSIERLKALIDFQKQNDSPQIQYLILKEVGPALQEFYDEKNMIYSLYENLNTKTKEEKIVMNNEELQYSKSEEENLKKFSAKDMEDFLKSVTEETTISGFTNMTQNIKNNQKAIEEKNQTQNNDTKENKGWDIDDN